MFFLTSYSIFINLSLHYTNPRAVLLKKQIRNLFRKLHTDIKQTGSHYVATTVHYEMIIIDCIHQALIQNIRHQSAFHSLAAAYPGISAPSSERRVPLCAPECVYSARRARSRQQSKKHTRVCVCVKVKNVPSSAPQRRFAPPMKG